jgi:hypothetical protein
MKTASAFRLAACGLAGKTAKPDLEQFYPQWNISAVRKFPCCQHFLLEERQWRKLFRRRKIGRCVADSTMLAILNIRHDNTYKSTL